MLGKSVNEKDETSRFGVSSFSFAAELVQRTESNPFDPIYSGPIPGNHKDYPYELHVNNPGEDATSHKR